MGDLIERADLEGFDEACRAMGLSLGEEGEARIRVFVEELLRWNRRINLTGERDARGVLFRHVLDSLAAMRCLAGVGRLLDVGPGGGFPGLPLKIFRPGMELVMLEARRKRASFLSEVVRRMGLEGVRVIWGRFGEGKEVEQEIGGRVGAVISRAAIPGWGLLAGAKEVVEDGGRVVLMKGELGAEDARRLEEELSRAGWREVEVISYRLPVGGGGNLVVVR